MSVKLPLLGVRSRGMRKWVKERVLYFVCLSCFVGHIADSSASALFHHKRKLLVPHVSNEGNILIRRFPSLMKLFLGGFMHLIKIPWNVYEDLINCVPYLSSHFGPTQAGLPLSLATYSHHANNSHLLLGSFFFGRNFWGLACPFISQIATFNFIYWFKCFFFFIILNLQMN